MVPLNLWHTSYNLGMIKEYVQPRSSDHHPSCSVLNLLKPFSCLFYMLNYSPLTLRTLVAFNCTLFCLSHPFSFNLQLCLSTTAALYFSTPELLITPSLPHSFNFQYHTYTSSQQHNYTSCCLYKCVYAPAAPTIYELVQVCLDNLPKGTVTVNLSYSYMQLRVHLILSLCCVNVDFLIEPTRICAYMSNWNIAYLILFWP